MFLTELDRTFFSADSKCLMGKKKKKEKKSYCCLLCRAVASHSCFLPGFGDIVSSRPPPVRFTPIHLKESHFHAWYENSFLTLITLLLPLRTKCSLLKLISQQGLLSKNSDVPSYHLWSMGLRENLLWINCKYHLPNFYLDISLMLT